MVKIGEEYKRKLILFSVLKFDHNFKTLPVYYNKCLWLSVLNIIKSKILCVEDYIFRCPFPHYCSSFELCIYCER